MANSYECFDCKTIVSMITSPEKRCPSCGGTNGQVLSCEQVERGTANGVYFGIGPSGKPLHLTDRERAERQLILDWNALPEAARQTDFQAQLFAEKMQNNYQFKYKGNRFDWAYATIQRYMRDQERVGTK